MAFHRKVRKFFMPHILVIAQHAGHDCISEVVDTSRSQDALRPVPSLLFLRVCSFVIFLAYLHQDSHWIVVEAKTDSMRSCAHADRIAHVVLKPVVNARLDFLFARSILDAWREGRRGKVEVDQLAGVCVFGAQLSTDPVTPVTALNHV